MGGGHVARCQGHIAKGSRGSRQGDLADAKQRKDYGHDMDALAWIKLFILQDMLFAADVPSPMIHLNQKYLKLSQHACAKLQTRGSGSSVKNSSKPSLWSRGGDEMLAA